MADDDTAGGAAARGLKVFLSYSRKDIAFARRLADALAARGYAPDFDQAAYDPDDVSTGIAADDEWWQRLQEMIAACETMVFVVSPDSAASKVCDEEIAYARGLGKRIMPLWRRRFDLAAAPPRLSALHIGLDFTADDDAAFAAALDLLCKALEVDVAWYRESARLAALAARWDIAGRPDDLLLSAADVRAVSNWLEDRPQNAPRPSPVVLALRNVSRDRLDTAGRIEPARSDTPSTTGAVSDLVPRSDLQAAAPAPLTPRSPRPAIGPWDQRPEIARHVEKLGPVSPLAALLAEPALDDRLKVYEDANAEAERAQNGYKHWGRIALVLMTVATLVSALMLFPLERLWPEANRWQGIVSALQSAANIIALFVVWSLNRRGAVGRWMETRAEAERLRGGFFRAMLQAPTPAGVDAGRLWREKLALFDAAHLDYQSAYYRSAIRRHSRNSSARAWPRALAASAIGISITLGLGALLYNFGFGVPGGLSAAIAKLQASNLGEPIRWQLGLNTAASALLAYASARAIISQDERNAALYRMTLNRLDALRNEERREAVAASASAGDGVAVLAYAEEAQEILDADHLAWRLSRPPEVVGEAPPAVLKV